MCMYVYTLKGRYFFQLDIGYLEISWPVEAIFLNEIMKLNRDTELRSVP